MDRTDRQGRGARADADRVSGERWARWWSKPARSRIASEGLGREVDEPSNSWTDEEGLDAL